MTPRHVLIVSPDAAGGEELAGALRREGHAVVQAGDGRTAAEVLAEPGIDLVVIDVRTADLSMSGLRKALDPEGPAAPDSLDDAERRHILQVLRHARGNKRQAAIILGISRSTLLHKVRKYQISVTKP